MRTLYLLLLLVPGFTCVFSQDNTDYYSPVFPKPIGSKQYTVESLLKKFGEVKIHNRWYTGLNGFVRTDKNTLSDSFDDLISTESPATYGWSVVAGWIGNENWGVEVEYARSPIHNVLLINGDNSLSYKFTNDKNSLILRGKRRLLFGKPYLRRSAFWISGGIGLIPNSGKQKDYREFYGYKQKGRRQGVDTLAMISETRTSDHVTGLVEASAEYVLKVAKSIDLGFFVRKQWGLGTSVTTNLDYYVNQKKTQTATIKGDGSGWNFGLSLRYVFEIGYDFENLRRHDGLQ